MGEMTTVRLHRGILLGCEKGGNLTLCDSTDGPRGYYARRGKSDTDKCHVTSHMCGM